MLNLRRTAKKSVEAGVAAGAIVTGVILVAQFFNPEYKGLPAPLVTVATTILAFGLKWIRDWKKHRG